jgi:hypothetical protein
MRDAPLVLVQLVALDFEVEDRSFSMQDRVNYTSLVGG